MPGARALLVNGALTGYIDFYRLPPLRRTPTARVYRQGPQHDSSILNRHWWAGFGPRRVVITLFNRDQGWT